MPPLRSVLAVLTFLLTLHCAGRAQELSLLGDLDPSGDDERWSFPAYFAELGSSWVFRASEPRYGEELWISDGTPHSTRLLVDLEPGPVSANIYELRSIGPVALFHARTSQDGNSLWRTDGTAAGTTLLTRFDRHTGGNRDPGISAVAGGRYWFRGSDLQHGIELWVSDGTVQGTRRVTDLYPGAESSWPSYMVAFGQRLVFWAGTPQSGVEPWITDGTVQGTHRITDLWSGPSPISSRVTEVVTDGKRLFVLAWFTRPTLGYELWTTDGTKAGTAQLDAALAQLEPWGISNLALHNGQLWFAGQHKQHGWGLWSSDGTLAGTGYAVDFDVNAADHNTGTCRYVWSFGNALWCSVFMPNEGEEIWRSDGTQQGTALALALQPGPTLAFRARPRGNFAGRFWFEGRNVNQETVLWTSDGTPQGTTQLAVLKMRTDIHPAGTRVAFSADDDVHGAEPWVSDGTPQGTRLLANIAGPVQPRGSAAGRFVGHGGRSWFTASDQQHGREFWTSDGTKAGTLRLADIAPGQADGARSDFVPAGERLFAAADDGVNGTELWMHDPVSGLRLVRDIRPGSASSDPQLLGAFGRDIVVRADDGTHGSELWISDGTPGGTVLLGDLTPGAAGSQIPGGIAPRGDVFYFVANDALWRSDGTPAGTARVPLPAAITRAIFVRTLDDELLLGVRTSLASQLWRSDGTLSGTRPLSPSQADVETQHIVQGEGFVAFLATSPAEGRELWWSDGTPAGTRALDLSPGTAGTQIGTLVPFDDRLLFLRTDGRGEEPWITGGTLASTALLGDLAPGAASSGSYGFEPAGTRHLYFLANDDYVGTELYRTDGTPAGTKRILFLAKGRGGDRPELLGQVAGRLVVRFAEELTGMEPFLVVDGAMTWPLGAPCGPLWLDLHASDAVLAGSTHYDARSASGLQPLLMILGTPAFAPPLWFSTDCVTQFDPATIFYTFAFVGSGRCTLQVPADNALSGLRIVPQLFTISGSTPVLSSSRAWLQQLGR